jgi:steroid delta-isomerase-like uncharacterized protein
MEVNMSAEQNVANAKLAIEAINNRDWSFIPKLLAPNFVRHDLSGDFDDITGHKGMEDFLQLVIKAIPDYQIQIEDMFATEDRLALRFVASGTHEGEFLGYPPTGKTIKANQINLYRFEGNKIAETWQLMDMAGFFQQIGVLNLDVIAKTSSDT